MITDVGKHYRTRGGGEAKIFFDAFEAKSVFDAFDAAVAPVFRYIGAVRRKDGLWMPSAWSDCGHCYEKGSEGEYDLVAEIGASRFYWLDVAENDGVLVAGVRNAIYSLAHQGPQNAVGRKKLNLVDYIGVWDE